MPSLSTPQPTTNLAQDAAAAARVLSKIAAPTGRRAAGKRITLEARDQGQKVRAEIPMPLFELFLRMLSEVGAGRAVTLVPMGKELTTQQAADFLNVSRPYLIQLLGEGRLPFRKVGTRRRIRLDDLLKFKALDDAERDRAAALLTKEAEDLGLEY